MSEVKRIAREESKLVMTPMIDVTFLLLIFFMCTIKFKTLEGKLSAFLPPDVGVNPTDAEASEETVLRVEVVRAGTRLDPLSAARLASRDPASVLPWSGVPGSRFVHGDDRLVRFQLGPRSTTDLDVLASRLRELHEAALARGEDKPALTLEPGAGIVYEDVVHALDRAVQANYTEIRFAGTDAR